MSKRTQDILKGKDLAGKYDAIEAFLFSTFNVTNPATVSMTRANLIMANMVLEELKNIDSIVAKDIEGIKLKDIDVIDITSGRESEISRFIYHSLLKMNAYDYKRIDDDMRAYLKAQKLEKVYPIEKRRERLEELQAEIERTNDMINAISEIDKNLAKSYSKKLSELQREYQTIEETICFKDITVIKAEVYSRVIARMNTIKDRIMEKIEFLEGVIGK